MSTDDAPEVDDLTTDAVVDDEPEAPEAEGENAAEELEETPETEEAEEAPEEDEESDDDDEAFSNLDPNTLPKELRATYRSMQRDYTAKMQEVAQLRDQAAPLSEWAGFLDQQGINPGEAPLDAFKALAAGFEEAGVDVDALLFGESEATDGPEDLDLDALVESDDPTIAALARHIQQTGQKVDQRSQAEQQAEQDQQALVHMSEQFKSIAEEMGVETLDEDYAMVLAEAAKLDENGLPDLLAAHDRIQKVTGVRKERVKQSKKAPKSPPDGSAGREDYDVTDENQRKARMRALAG